MDKVIGILGGMGTYATIHLFRQYARIFHAEKEWDRPRIIIDNHCTIPSRVRAYLYGENKKELIEKMTHSLQHLKDSGCDKIVIGCNTAHIFLPEIYDRDPSLNDVVENIIDDCVNAIYQDDLKDIYILGSEGTLDSGIYQKALAYRGITNHAPDDDEFYKIRMCMEAVKRGRELEQVQDIFLDLINRHDNCVIGCTELPILYEKFKSLVTCEKVYDPMDIALRKIKKEYEEEEA